MMVGGEHKWGTATGPSPGLGPVRAALALLTVMFAVLLGFVGAPQALALEAIEIARGHLYTFHRLSGTADLTLGQGVEQLREAGHGDLVYLIDRELVGRNVLDGRWTFQIVEEFDDLYYRDVRDELRRLEREHMGGRPHVFESEMKERRRSRARPGHEDRPATSHDDRVETQADGAEHHPEG